MGDRAMCEIICNKNDDRLYIYTHWSGSDLDCIAAEALQLAQPRLRIGDIDYALKTLVFWILDKACEGANETGGGLMFGPFCEDEYNGDNPSVIVNLVKNTVESFGRKSTIFKGGTNEWVNTGNL